MGRWLLTGLLCWGYVVRSLAIEAVATHSIFYLPDANAYKLYAEVYWQIAPSSLQFTEIAPGQFTAKIRTDIVFKNETGVVLEDHYILQTTPATSLQQATAQVILEFKKYILPYGKHKLELKLQDAADTGTTFIYTDSIINQPLSNKPVYSSIQLLDTSFASAQKSVFLKNGKQQIPLCANFIDKDRNTLFYYAELYKSNLLPDDILPLSQTVYISKRPLEDPVFKLQRIDTPAKAVVNTIWGSFDISMLPSGNYYLNIILKNNLGEKIGSSQQFFQRINSSNKKVSDADTGGFVQMEVFDISTTFVTKYNTAQLKAIFKMIKPISTPVEVLSIDNFLKTPDETYMRYFLYNFWKGRNAKDPKAAWEDYANQIREVRRMFDGGGQPGYETERGVIYLKHGKPTEIINVENEEGAEPYQIWVYTTMARQSNGGMFLFYRPGIMIGDYQLLHSNVKGETRNLDWRTLLYKAGKRTSMSNSRAEQYFTGAK